MCCDDEIVYRVFACGVCPSDVRRWNGSRAGGEKLVLGHESVGEVIEMGKNVEGIAVGDRVARDWRDTCGECAYCRKGLYNFCLRAETPDRLGFMGGFCELSKARGAACRRIPEDLAYEEAAFSEPLACCINAQQLAAGSDGAQIQFEFLHALILISDHVPVARTTYAAA